MCAMTEEPKEKPEETAPPADAAEDYPPVENIGCPGLSTAAKRRMKEDQQRREAEEKGGC
jgi:hypothetical protein